MGAALKPGPGLGPDGTGAGFQLRLLGPRDDESLEVTSHGRLVKSRPGLEFNKRRRSERSES
ncbi:uncharacterized protein V6R79_010374 [Siganus canaliculatus]